MLQGALQQQSAFGFSFTRVASRLHDAPVVFEQIIDGAAAAAAVGGSIVGHAERKVRRL